MKTSSRLSRITPTRTAAAASAASHATALPWIVTPQLSEALPEWYQNHQAQVTDALRGCGGVLFRGFRVQSGEEFEQFVRAVSPTLLEYKERSTPRTEVGNRIYTSTEYPAHQPIAHHNEFSYANAWPMRIFFFGLVPPQQGGETPIADSRKVYADIPEEVRTGLQDKGVMYVRNYGSGIDLTWQEAFQTNDRAVVEEYCQQAPLEWEWLSDDRLRTRQMRPAVARHPVTGETVWFNQAHLFHVSNLEPETRASMQSIYEPEDLPRNCYLGDGAPIPDSFLDAIRAAYQKNEVALPWKQGDVMMLDNMLVAHGRRPYSGPRRILTALSEPYDSRAA